MEEKNELEIATIGGGCFWCIEAVFQKLKGVSKVVSGYSGGHVKNPCYREVCQKTTGHAEVTQIHFDPSVIDFETLLKVFWTVHNPTTPNQQGNDVGPQYRSVIYYHDEAQKAIAEKSKLEIATDLWESEIVTEIEPLDVFYPAEAEHQNFYRLNPNYGYCRVIINPKVSKLKSTFAELLTD